MKITDATWSDKGDGYAALKRAVVNRKVVKKEEMYYVNF